MREYKQTFSRVARLRRLTMADSRLLFARTPISRLFKHNTYKKDYSTSFLYLSGFLFLNKYRTKVQQKNYIRKKILSICCYFYIFIAELYIYAVFYKIVNW